MSEYVKSTRADAAAAAWYCFRKWLYGVQARNKLFGKAVNRMQLPRLFCFVILVYYFMGCGYTILRDLDAEARQAEFAAIDSLTSAPDLTITKIEYNYRYLPGPQHVIDPIDARGSYMVTFHLTIENVGNADFTKPYLLVYRNLDPRPYQSNSFGTSLLNQKGETILPDSSQEIKLFFEPQPDSTSYTFTIVTNSIIQGDLIQALERHVNRPLIPPLSREFRYDNNEASITLPGLQEILHGGQQPQK